MKQLLVLTTLISSLIIPSVAYAEWEKTMFGKLQFYVDFEKVRQKNNNNYLVWMLLNDDKNERSATMLMEFDCKALSFRNIGSTVYDKTWALGNVTYSDRDIDKWVYPDPNSNFEKQTTKICKKLD